VSESNLDIARKYVTQLSNGAGPEALEAFFSPDVVQEEFPNRLMPNGATRNRRAMTEARARGKALLSAEKYELLNAVASGDQVVMEVVWTGTIRAAAGSFTAGQSLRARFAVFMEFQDGRIIRQRNYDCFDPW